MDPLQDTYFYLFDNPKINFSGHVYFNLFFFAATPE